MKIKKGDTIKVTSGRDRGRQGKVEKVISKKSAVVVAGLNIVKKHVRPQGEKKPGGIIEIPKPINIAKIALICPKCNEVARVGFKVEKEKKFRICKKCQERIDK